MQEIPKKDRDIAYANPNSLPIPKIPDLRCLVLEISTLSVDTGFLVAQNTLQKIKTE